MTTGVKCHHYCNEPLRCPTCAARFWAWAQTHTNGKGSKKSRAKSPGVGSFYDYVNRIAPPLPAE